MWITAISSVGTGPAAVVPCERGAGVSISLELGGEFFAAEGRDCFGAFQELREELEGLGISLLCAGARTDAYPSPMLREATRGRSVYLLRMHRVARRTCDIFDPAPVSKVGTIASQEAYYRKWRAGTKLDTPIWRLVDFFLEIRERLR